MFRTVESFVTGSRTAGMRNRKFTTYTPQGDALDVTAELSGTIPLDRTNDAGRTSAPPPADASGGVGSPVRIAVMHEERDGFGNVKLQTGANGRCRIMGQDETYADLTTSETTRAGRVPDGQNCGEVALVTSVKYDRAFGLVTDLLDVRGEPTHAAYDGLARIVALTHPSPYVANGDEPALSVRPSVKVEYLITDDWTKRPFSILHTSNQDGADHDSDSYEESWAYVDGLGRTLVTLKEADPDAGDEGHFIAQGLPDYDAKGTPRRAYLPFFFEGSPDKFPLAATPAVPYGRQRHDAFGRQLETFGLDGQMTLRAVHHALSQDNWDAADLEPGPHHGTPASLATDGHGRSTIFTSRVHVGNGIEERRVINEYLPTGEVFRITRKRVGKSDPDIVRWMQFDSLGRMVLNAEPHTSKDFHVDPSAPIGSMRAWRYAYNDANDLVGTSDARGCGRTSATTRRAGFSTKTTRRACRNTKNTRSRISRIRPEWRWCISMTLSFPKALRRAGSCRRPVSSWSFHRNIWDVLRGWPINHRER